MRECCRPSLRNVRTTSLRSTPIRMFWRRTQIAWPGQRQIRRFAINSVSKAAKEHSLVEKTIRKPLNRILFRAKRIKKTPKRVLYGAFGILSETKRILKTIKRILFRAKRILKMTKGILFNPKRIKKMTNRILFAAKRDCSTNCVKKNNTNPQAVAILQICFSRRMVSIIGNHHRVGM